MAAFTYTKPTVGGSEDTWGTTLNANWDALGTFLSALDSTELAVLDGITATTAELNILDGVTATAAELNLLDGATVALADITATATELNYVGGVTSAIQTQLDGKASDAVQDQAVWEAGTGTTESLVSPAKVKAAGVASFTDQEQQIGVGQTWERPTRSNGTVYQNTTGKPIMVQVTTNNDGSFQVSDDNVTFVTVAQTSSGRDNTSFIVPDQHYYKSVSISSIDVWAELR